MRFLIDECLTPELADEANRAGFEAYHVAHLGMAGRKDWNVVRRALDNDLILVTNDARDFRALYEQERSHPGLVILIPNVKSTFKFSYSARHFNACAQ